MFSASFSVSDPPSAVSGSHFRSSFLSDRVSLARRCPPVPFCPLVFSNRSRSKIPFIGVIVQWRTLSFWILLSTSNLAPGYGSRQSRLAARSLRNKPTESIRILLAVKPRIGLSVKPAPRFRIIRGDQIRPTMALFAIPRAPAPSAESALPSASPGMPRGLRRRKPIAIHRHPALFSPSFSSVDPPAQKYRAHRAAAGKTKPARHAD
jgi:hypothetical protein